MGERFESLVGAMPDDVGRLRHQFRKLWVAAMPWGSAPPSGANMQACQNGNGPAWKAAAGSRGPNVFNSHSLRQKRSANCLVYSPEEQRKPKKGSIVGRKFAGYRQAPLILEAKLFSILCVKSKERRKSGVLSEKNMLDNESKKEKPFIIPLPSKKKP